MNRFLEQAKCIGAAIGHCAGILGCEIGSEVLYQRLDYLQEIWYRTISFDSQKTQLAAIPDLADFSRRLAEATIAVLAKGNKFLTLGGDHSCAIGTWSGVAQCYDEFGLIWIDAHLDSHTPETSFSGNLHGMSAAALMGFGDKRLTTILSEQAKVKPENIVFMGIRSYEKEEQQLLAQHGVKVYYMEDVRRLGFQSCFATTIKTFEQRDLPFGITLDLDALDPHHIQALGTPEEDGMQLKNLLAALSMINLEQLIGLEITEYNPELDDEIFSGSDVVDSIINRVGCD
ncbi:MAG: arginase [Pseudomonadota bacterium]